jgi:hypothetical protein
MSERKQSTDERAARARHPSSPAAQANAARANAARANAAQANATDRPPVTFSPSDPLPERDGYGAMAAAVEKTLAALALPPTDAGMAALLRAYAIELDTAEARAQRFDKILARCERDRDPESWDALQAARGMLGARATLDRIGGRLHAGLDALRATPKARPALPPVLPGNASLTRLRLAAGTDVDAHASTSEPSAG